MPCTLIRRYISKGVLKALQRFALKYLGLKLTQRAIITKTVPLVGAGIGATWNHDSASGAPPARR
ncbi:hypothetical protein [Corallococcus caeni]|uniref:Uncharacterized protein n=1 Tax=Corallococcus caeni TaxID=3082388 RepID=A0ABQ6QJM7_9BACT|nr:hypothetical protein ASNO1_01510 [Corallococcus sp. NO1]